MADHAHALETTTGLDSRKLAIWTFIGSECMFFATLISNYLVNKGIERKRLLGILQERGAELGVQHHFQQEITDDAPFADADLIVGGPPWLERNRFDIAAKAPQETRRGFRRPPGGRFLR